MKKIRVAINGFGRIGRVFFRLAIKNPQIEIVAINDLTDSKTLAHLLKYDSIHRILDMNVGSGKNEIIVGEKSIPVFSFKNPEELPWKQLEVDVVVESTGFFLSTAECKKHIDAGAKKVIISAPAKDDTKSVVLGVNDEIINSTDVILSNASCTTNCASPMIKILHENWGIEEAYISTVHAYTGDQRLHDSPHKDLRRARAAALSIVPTSTGAAKAITKIFPDLDGKVGGCGIRVPVADGSLTDISCVLKQNPTKEEINSAFKKEAEGRLKGILEYTEDPLVSVDVIGNTHSCIFDAEFTSIVGNLVKVIGWYDNETGYSARLLDLILKIQY
ncbi:MAG: type I glyceraldehyde-3-phosphate dehydrogenase [Bacteroidota bacterium]|jgi:glyceraldehyde 3-phosphate dehydrogenase